MARKGEIWNESRLYRDAWTLRDVRQVTTHGLYNETPTYHTDTAFTADGELFVFGSAREDHSAVFRCHTASGDIQQLIDPLPGVGGYGDVHKGSGVALGDGRGATGNMSLAPRSRWLVFVADQAVRAVHIETLRERVLIADLGDEWVPGRPSIDPTESNVIIPLMPAHPDVLAGKRMSLPYREYFTRGRIKTRLIQVPLAGGAVTTVYEEGGIGCAHCPHCPTDPDLLLIDRDFAPGFWAGSDGKTNRIWTLRLSTGKLTELKNRDQAKFQVHSVWTWDGEHVLYHGRSAQAGHYVGVVDKNGQTVREYGFHQAPHYGHVSAMAGRRAVILDGNITNDLLLWVYYDQEDPRVEVICRHGTAWGALPGQYTHPHPLSDPTGRWISFNVGSKGRSDVYLAKV